MTHPMNQDMSLRTFRCVVAGCAAAATTGCSDFTHTDFFRKNFRDLSSDELADIVASQLQLSAAEQQMVLETFDVKERLAEVARLAHPDPSVSQRYWA